MSEEESDAIEAIAWSRERKRREQERIAAEEEQRLPDARTVAPREGE